MNLPLLSLILSLTLCPISWASHNAPEGDMKKLVAVDKHIKDGIELENKIHDDIYRAYLEGAGAVSTQTNTATHNIFPKDLLRIITGYLAVYKSPMPQAKCVYSGVYSARKNEIENWLATQKSMGYPAIGYELSRERYVFSQSRECTDYNFRLMNSEQWKKTYFNMWEANDHMKGCTDCIAVVANPSPWMDPVYYHIPACKVYDDRYPSEYLRKPSYESVPKETGAAKKHFTNFVYQYDLQCSNTHVLEEFRSALMRWRELYEKFIQSKLSTTTK